MPTLLGGEDMRLRRSYKRVAVNGDLSTWDISGPALTIDDVDSAAEELVNILCEHGEPASLVCHHYKVVAGGLTLTVVIQRSILRSKQAG